MKYLKPYKLFESKFESKFDEVKSMIDNLKDICQEFEDNNCSCRIEPSNDIRIKVMALQGKGEVFQDINMPFYIEIDIDRRIIAPDEKRSGFGPLPGWFIESCRRIEDYMSSEGFKTLPSIRYGTDWENFDTIDELAEQESLIYKVKLEFYNNDKITESQKTDIMNLKYDSETISECDSIISDIKDMLLELQDIGLFITVGYTPMTLAGREDSPKIMAEVQGDSLTCSYIEDDIDSAFERIKSYTSSKGYVNGFGTWERDVDSGKKMSVYQILIQK